MPVIYGEGHPIAVERAKWEREATGWTPERNPFPKMLYKARRRPDGVISCGEPAALDHIFGGPGSAEQWSRGCQLIVQAGAYDRAKADGWSDTIPEAMEAFQREHDRQATATAHRHYEDRGMSEAAQREAAAADAASSFHVPEVPEQRLRRKPGPKPKIQPES